MIFPRCGVARHTAILAFAGLIVVQAAMSQPAGQHWLGTWSTADVVRPPTRPAAPGQPQPVAIHIDNQTLRQVVHVSAGGVRERVVLSNLFGSEPLAIGAAQVALREKESGIVTGSNRALTFAGRSSVTIPTGAVMFSDAIDLTVPAMSDLAVDLFLPGDLTQTTLTSHFGANQTNYISNTGNFVGAAEFPVSSTAPSWFFLERVEVLAPMQVGAVIAFGDSITDGTRSTADTNSRWPDQLARRLLAKPGDVQGILNAAIAGNRLLSEGNVAAGMNALARFNRDVLAQTGARYVIVLEGINDIGTARQSPEPSAEDLIAAHEQMVERAHAHGLKMFGATLTPFEGAAYFTPAGEVKRQAFNAWMRNNKFYDGVIDFDSVVRDPQNPSKILMRYDSGDHLHPNDAGYEAMGGAIDLKLFGSGGMNPKTSSKRK